MASEIQLLAPPQGANATLDSQVSKGGQAREGGAFGVLMELAMASLAGTLPQARLQAGTGVEAAGVAGQQTESGDGAGPVETHEAGEAGVEAGGDVRRESSSGRAESVPGSTSQIPAEAIGSAVQLAMAGFLAAEQGGRTQQAPDPPLTATPGGAMPETAPPAGTAVDGGQGRFDRATGQSRLAAPSEVGHTEQPASLVREQVPAQADDVVALVRTIPEPQTAPGVFGAGSRVAVASGEPQVAHVESIEEADAGTAESIASNGEAGGPAVSSRTAARDLAQSGPAVSAGEPKNQEAARSEEGGQGATQEASADGDVHGKRPQRNAGPGFRDGGVREAPLPEAFRASATADAPTARKAEGDGQGREQGLPIRDARALSETLLQESLKRLPRNVEIRIDPPEIGKVTVLLSQRGQDVTVKFVAGTGEALRMLANDAGDLGRALSEKGLELVGFAVDPGTDGSASGAGGDAGKQNNRRYPRPSEFRGVGEVHARSPYAYLSNGGFDRLA